MDNKKYPEHDNSYPRRMLPGTELAKAYVPYQVMGKVFEPREALCKGTLFPELYKPYNVKK